jgi:hypothetical protein
MIRKKRNKYGAIKVLAYGIKFDSKKEKKRYDELTLLVKAGEIQSFIHQVPFIYEIDGKKMFKYIADYVIINMDGSRRVEDVKGFDKKTKKFRTTPLFNLKKKLIEAQYKIKIELY